MNLDAALWHLKMFALSIYLIGYILIRYILLCETSMFLKESVNYLTFLESTMTDCCHK